MGSNRAGTSSFTPTERVVPETPAGAGGVFGDRLAAAEAYVALLADTGLSHGLIGPRELPRLWDRHVLNCAVIAELVPPGSLVADVGSGAGLPGIPLAIARPDCRVVLIEPLLRRTRWLDGVLADLGLDNVQVRRGRAESLAGEVVADVVTARAVSRLRTLASWCAPLLRDGGLFLALKGATAPEELAADAGALRAAGLFGGQVVQVGAAVVDAPTHVVRAERSAGTTPAGRGPSRAQGAGRNAGRGGVAGRGAGAVRGSRAGRRGDR